MSRRVGVAIALVVLLAGCGGTRLRVTDATTGKPIDGARLTAEDARGAELAAARSGGDGRARLSVPPGAGVVVVAAEGYRLTGVPARELASALVHDVALQPAWVGAFMDGGVRRQFAPGESHDGTPKPCPCHQAR